MPRKKNRKFVVRVAAVLVAVTLAVAASASGQQAAPDSHGKTAAAAASPQLAGLLAEIPEPASVGLIVTGALLIVGRHRWRWRD